MISLRVGIFDLLFEQKYISKTLLFFLQQDYTKRSYWGSYVCRWILLSEDQDHGRMKTKVLVFTVLGFRKQQEKSWREEFKQLTILNWHRAKIPCKICRRFEFQERRHRQIKKQICKQHTFTHHHHSIILTTCTAHAEFIMPHVSRSNHLFFSHHASSSLHKTSRRP